MICPVNFFPLMMFSWFSFLTQAGWKLWPFAHLITYGVIPVEQRLLWVDCVELIWVTILSTYVIMDLFLNAGYQNFNQVLFACYACRVNWPDFVVSL